MSGSPQRWSWFAWLRIAVIAVLPTTISVLDVCFINSRPQPPGVVYRAVVDRGVVQTAVTCDQTRLSRVVACDGSRQKGFPGPAVPPCRSNGRDERGVNCGDRGIARSQHRTLPLNRNLHVLAIGGTRY